MNELNFRIAQNGRYFVDQNDSPQFWLGDTQWNLFRCHTFEEAKIIIENRREKGFTVIQVMLLGIGHEVSAETVLGEAFPEKDPAIPNPAYFKHVDSIIEHAQKNGITLVIGLDHPRIRLTTISNARTYGRWIGERYKEYPNIIWSATYLIPEGENLEIMREVALGLREGDGGKHLITCHPDPAYPVATSGISHNELWLDFNCIQTFSAIGLICDSIADDYSRVPSKPVVMAEGAYEDGPEYGFAITPYLVRKQAYLTYFSGGHHSYGHNDNWRVLPTWRSSLDSPGAQQLSVLKNVFSPRRWWELIPDQTIFKNDTCGDSTLNNALRMQNGDLTMVYSSSPNTFCIDMDKLTSAEYVSISWIDPRNGEELDAGSFPAAGDQMFSCPQEWEDSLLMIEAAK